MQSAFVQQYYNHEKARYDKKYQKSMMLKLLQPCLISTVISFLTFYERNTCKLVCFDIYRCSKESNLIANQHTVLTSATISKIQQKQLDITKFFHHHSNLPNGCLELSLVPGDSEEFYRDDEGDSDSERSVGANEVDPKPQKSTQLSIIYQIIENMNPKQLKFEIASTKQKILSYATNFDWIQLLHWHTAVGKKNNSYEEYTKDYDCKRKRSMARITQISMKYLAPL